jgi:biotin transport system substrate-specific component
MARFAGASWGFEAEANRPRSRMNRATSHVLVDQFSNARSLTLDLLWMAGFGLLTALLAQVEIRLPFSPVPLTGQTFAVLLSGAVLGSRRAFASQAFYLAAGAAGMPVFAGGASTLFHLLGPTGGYLWSFPFAAALTGWLVERGTSRQAWKLALTLFLSDALILVSGALWLSGFFRVPFRHAALLGFYPFLIGDVLKVSLVGLTLPKILRRYRDPENQPPKVDPR